jgi:predicted nucleic-acid-binding Zn-ribbon protein
MAAMSLVCPKCSGRMESGHLPDTGYGQVLQSSWAPGEPVVRRFVGGIKSNPKEQLPITALRCSKCGYLELYAPLG